MKAPNPFATVRPVQVSYLGLLRIAVVCHLVLAVPVLGIALIAGWISVDIVSAILVQFFVLFTPAIALLGWLIAKGSNWQNSGLAAVIGAGHSFWVYEFVVGYVIVRQLPGLWVGGGVALAWILFAQYTLFVPYCQAMLGWLASDLKPAKWQSTA